LTAHDPLADAPLELLAYFDDSDALRATALSINPLTRRAAVEYAESIRQVPVGEQLGLVPLEDADNSKPFCYITRGPATGMILQFNRGDGQTLRYPSLASFVSALRRAKESGIDIEDLEPVPIPAAAKQADISIRLIEALSMEPREAEFAVEHLLPLLDPENIDVLDRLSQADNFLIRECVAIFLERNPRTQHEHMAQRLAADKYGQVASPAAAAAKIIRRMKWEQRRDGA
jgi:hypothetical protein